MLIWNLLAEAGEEASQGTNWGSYVIMGVLFVAIIGLFIWQSRKSKKEQKEAQEKINKLKIGDRVKTIGGICGFVAQINDAENTFVLETGLEENKSYVKFDKGAIYQTAPAQGAVVKAEEDAKTEAKEQEKAEEQATDQAPKKTRKKRTEDEI